METIHDVAQAAAKAVWGEHEEPVSGKTGDTSKGEPYDAGNMGKPRTTTGVTGSDAVKPTEYSSTGGGNYVPSSRLDASDSDVVGASRYTGFTQNAKIAPLEDNYNPAGGVNKTGSNTEGTTGSNTEGTTGSNTEGTTGSNTEGTTRTNQTQNKPDTKEADEVNTSGRDKAASGPHKEFGSSTEPGKDMSKAQQDVRDPSDPLTDPKDSKEKSNVDDTDQNPDTGGKVDSAGPRPLGELAKEGGGDAGKAEGEGKAGDDDEDEGDGPQKKSHGEGTGEKYVKSSGLKADGGDFDAQNPGAGREADRLLEQKGVHREVGKPGATTDDDAQDNPAAHEKKGLGQKIKEKLHKH